MVLYLILCNRSALYVLKAAPVIHELSARFPPSSRKTVVMMMMTNNSVVDVVGTYIPYVVSCKYFRRGFLSPVFT